MCFGGGGGQQQPYPAQNYAGATDYRTAEQKQRDAIYQTHQEQDLAAQNRIDKTNPPTTLGAGASQTGSQVT